MSHDLAVTVRGYHSEEDSVLPLSWGSLLGLEREGGQGRQEGRGGEREGEEVKKIRQYSKLHSHCDVGAMVTASTNTK